MGFGRNQRKEMKAAMWIKFIAQTLALVLVSCVVAAAPHEGSVIQRVNLGVIFKHEGTDIAVDARRWTHLVRLPLPREQGADSARFGPCRDGEDNVLCFEDEWLALQSLRLVEQVDNDIGRAVCKLKQMLPRLPKNFTADSGMAFSVVGDSFGQALSGISIYQGTNLTQLNGHGSLYRVYSLESFVTQAAKARLDVSRYEDAVIALSQGQLHSQLLDSHTLKNITQYVQDRVTKKGLEHRVDLTSVGRQVQGYVDEEYLYICLSVRLITRPRPGYQVYKVYTFPVAAGPGSQYATQIAGLPDYFFLDTTASNYMVMSSDTYARCLNKDPQVCYRKLAKRPLSEKSCLLGVFRDDTEMIQDQCSFDLVHQGLESSIKEIYPGLVLLNNVRLLDILDCPKLHSLQTSLPFDPCRQCIRYVPCECAVRVGDQYFPPYPCSRDSQPLCIEAFQSQGNLADFVSANQSGSVKSSQACKFKPGSSSWVTHPVNMALWMIAGQNNTHQQHLRGSTLFLDESDLHLPDLKLIFEGWEGSLKKMTLQERVRTRLQNARVKAMSWTDEILFVVAVAVAAGTLLLLGFILWAVLALARHYKTVAARVAEADPMHLV